jgi:ATP-binding cassette subfamily B protein/ATP-binding cassette subfamily C protein
MMNEGTGPRLPLKRYWDLLAKYLEPLRFKVVLLAVLIFASIGLRLVNPQIIRYFIDTAIATSDDQTLLTAALMFLGIALLLQGIGVAATYVGEDIGWRATNNLRADLTLHCLRLDMSFHNDHTPGEMIERIDGDIADIAIFFAQFVIRILGNLLLIIGVFLLGEDWRISLALAIYTSIALAGLTYLRQIAVPHWKAAREAAAELFGFLEEHLAGTEDTRSSGAVGYVMRNLYKFNKLRLQKQLKAGLINILLIVMWIGLYTLGQGVALILGYNLFQEGVLTIGSVYLIIHYTDLIFRPLREITNQIQLLQKAAAGIERVESLSTLVSKIKTGTRPLSPSTPLTVVFDKVTFGYTETETVLQNVSFQLQAGKVLGLLGRTGSGKTSLIRLLFRLYNPNSGHIRLGMNGHQLDIGETRLEDLRQCIGMVTQDVQLFRATVRDNLTFFDKRVSDDKILQVVEELELSGWYNTLPQGLDTELATEGSSLSAGEAQLLAFTRVFLRDPGLVILDEASSRLDPATEQLIERAIDKLLANRTGIIIAHRLSTVHRADHILIVEGGRIREFGDYDDLAHDPNSRFYSLLQTGLEEVLA